MNDCRFVGSTSFLFVLLSLVFGPTRDALAATYRQICECLREGRLFRADG